MNDKPKILVIDDELSKALELFIKGLGYDVTVADSAIKGFDLCNSQGNKFDIIILDFKMPDMNGFDFLEEFGPDKETAVIMLTAYDERQLAVDAMKKGIFDFVSKDEATVVLDAKIKRAYEHVLMIKKISEGHKRLSDFINIEKKLQTGRDSKAILKEIINVFDHIIPYEILATAILQDKSDHYQIIESSPVKYKKIFQTRIVLENEFLKKISHGNNKISVLRNDQIQEEPIFKLMAETRELKPNSIIVIPLQYLHENIGFVVIHSSSPEIILSYHEKEYLEYYGTLAALIIKTMNSFGFLLAKNQIHKFNKGLIHELSTFPLTFERGISGDEKEDKEDALKELDRFRDLVGELKTTCSGIEKKFIFKKDSLSVSVNPIVNYIKKKIKKNSTDKTVKEVVFIENLKNDVDITVDQSKLYLALKIVIENGLRAISRDRTKSKGELRINCYGKDGYGIVKISDNGIGMDKELMEKIFDPFITGDNGGWGVGLAFAHDIVEEHGGHISVESEPGVGSHFYVHIPIVDKGES